jgi:hypothetical protein
MSFLIIPSYAVTTDNVCGKGIKKCCILHFHGDDYGNYCLLGSGAVQFGK